MIAPQHVFQDRQRLYWKISEEFSVKSFKSLEELINSSDGLHIVTPTNLHHGVAMECLRKIVVGRAFVNVAFWNRNRLSITEARAAVCGAAMDKCRLPRLKVSCIVHTP